MPKVYLSPSNQMHNRCQHGDVEGKHCPELAQMIAERLTVNGIDWMIRKPANSLSANMREAKAFGADLYIPLHTNAAGAGARGTRFGYNSNRSDSKAACQVFAARWKTFYPLPDKVKLAVYDHFGEAKSPHCPSVYTELLFHSNIEDAAFLHNNMGACADALVACISDYFSGGGVFPVENQTVKRGSQGDSVTKLQQALAKLGYSITIDGDFGAETERVLKQYQAAKGLEADGVCGPVTWATFETVAESDLYTVNVPPVSLEVAKAIVIACPDATYRKI